MENIKANVYIGKRNNKPCFEVKTIEVYTVDEATKMLFGKNWKVGKEAYSLIDKTDSVAWFADCGKGKGIWVECLRF